VGVISYKKMFISAMSLLCLFLIINFTVRWSVVPQVDNPIVRCSTIEIPTVKTDFLYSDFLKRRHNFHIDVNNELINTKSSLVKSNTELKIIFNHKPSNYALFRKLDNGNYEKVFDSTESTNRTFTTPSKPGKYVFSVSANYNEGL
jgi:hypothetical protein